jgi:hypothetical protein
MRIVLEGAQTLKIKQIHLGKYHKSVLSVKSKNMICTIGKSCFIFLIYRQNNNLKEVNIILYPLVELNIE